MTVDELEERLHEVLERVKNGERVLIASGGQPVAEIGP